MRASGTGSRGAERTGLAVALWALAGVGCSSARDPQRVRFVDDQKDGGHASSPDARVPSPDARTRPPADSGAFSDGSIRIDRLDVEGGVRPEP